MAVAESRPTVVYIAGAGRSGSTLLEALLGEATGATAVGEIRLFLAGGYRWNARCECGETFLECPFWARVMATTLEDTGADHRRMLEHTRRDFVRNRAVATLLRGRGSWSPNQQIVADVHDRLYASIARVAERSTIIDSSKTVAYGLFLAQLGSLDVRVVHLVRDSRAVANSWQRAKEWTQSPDDVAPMMRTRTPASTSREWMINNGLAGLLRRRAAAATIVRYEDLADDPEAVVASIIEDLDLRTEASADTSGESTERPRHGFLGNPTRFRTGPREIVADDAWVEEFGRRDRFITTLLTWPLLRRHGYRLRHRRLL